MAIFLNVSCLWCRQRERTHTLLVALFVIRGYLGLLRPSRSSSTLWSLLRGWSVSLLEYFVKNWTWGIVFEGWRFFLGTLIWQKIYERLLFTNIPPLKKTELSRLSRSKSVGGGWYLPGWLPGNTLNDRLFLFILFLHVWIASLNSEDDLFFVKQA